jgi:cytochrome oxidase assembly protein ShyY1
VAGFDTSTLKKPRWILALVVGALLALLFARLGIWQLDRLDERRARNAITEERSAADPESFDDLVVRYGLDAEALNLRSATVLGDYREDLEFFSIGRTVGDLTGTLVVTPLELDDGTLMVVVRGIVPSGTAGQPAEGFETPEGRVEVVGTLDDGEEPLRIGEPDPENGILTSLSRVDLEYIDRWTEGDVLPVSLTLVAQEPDNPNGDPIPIPPEELTEGSHLGYAIQWFGFAIIVLIGVGFLVWRAGSKSEVEPVG